MEPQAVMSLGVDVWKMGGAIGLLIFAQMGYFYFIFRASEKREARMARALEECQKHKDVDSAKMVEALVNNTHAQNTNSGCIRSLAEIMAARPCLKDNTPIKGNEQLFDHLKKKDPQ